MAKPDSVRSAERAVDGLVHRCRCEGRDLDWPLLSPGAPRTIISLVTVAALLAAFLVIETRVAEPAIPLRIFRVKTMRVANMAAVLVFGTFTAQGAGSALGLAVIAAIAYSGLAPARDDAGDNEALVRAANAAANHTAFLASAGLALVALLLAAFLMPRTDRQRREGRADSDRNRPDEQPRFNAPSTKGRDQRWRRSYSFQGSGSAAGRGRT